MYAIDLNWEYFIEENIPKDEIGEHFYNNSFIMEDTVLDQFIHLMKELNGNYEDENDFIPIGICMDESMQGYMPCWKPLVLENSNGETLYIHINYDLWKEYYDRTHSK